MFVLAKKRSSFHSLFFPFLKSINFTVYKKLSQLMLAAYMAFLTVTTNATNYYANSSGSDAITGNGENTPWKNLMKANSYTSKSGDQILFKKWIERFVCITVSDSLIIDLAYSFHKSTEYLTFVRKERNQLVLIPILELKISFSHPQYQHLSY